MITKMKKVMLFTPDISQDVDKDLTRLGQLGVVHIAPFQPAQDESIDRVDARIKQMQTAMDALQSVGEESTSVVDEDHVDFSSMERGEIVLMEEILNADNRRKQQEKLLKAQEDSLLWYSTVSYTHLRAHET